MNLRLFNPVVYQVVLAFAVMLAQWVGMVHRIEHHQQLEQGVHHSSSNILHDCLLLDALSTAHTPTCSTHYGFADPQLALIGVIGESKSFLPAHDAYSRVRVRDPPLQS